MIDELASMGEDAKRGNFLVIHRDSGRIGFVIDENYYRRYCTSVYDIQEFIPAG